MTFDVVLFKILKCVGAVNEKTKADLPACVNRCKQTYAKREPVRICMWVSAQPSMRVWLSLLRARNRLHCLHLWADLLVFFRRAVLLGLVPQQAGLWVWTGIQNHAHVPEEAYCGHATDYHRTWIQMAAPEKTHCRLPSCPKRQSVIREQECMRKNRSHFSWQQRKLLKRNASSLTREAPLLALTCIEGEVATVSNNNETTKKQINITNCFLMRSNIRHDNTC